MEDLVCRAFVHWYYKMRDIVVGSKEADENGGGGGRKEGDSRYKQSCQKV